MEWEGEEEEVVEPRTTKQSQEFEEKLRQIFEEPERTREIEPESWFGEREPFAVDCDVCYARGKGKERGVPGLWCHKLLQKCRVTGLSTSRGIGLVEVSEFAV